LQLLRDGRIVVQEDQEDTVKNHGVLKPKTKIFVRNEKTGVMQQKNLHPGLDGSLYINIYPQGRAGGLKRLSARRVVWYAFNPVRTSNMICPLDGDVTNFNIWNLCARDQNEQNYVRMQNRDRPNEDEVEPGDPDHTPSWLDDIPF
jgi:hypothetical protein